MGGSVTKNRHHPPIYTATRHTFNFPFSTVPYFPLNHCLLTILKYEKKKKSRENREFHF